MIRTSAPARTGNMCRPMWWSEGSVDGSSPVPT